MKIVPSSYMLKTQPAADQVFASKVQDLKTLLPVAGLTPKTAKFALSLIEQYQTGAANGHHFPLSGKQRMWVRLLLERSLIGPPQFPPILVDGTMQFACMGCGGEVGDEGEKNVCASCVRRLTKDD